MLISADAVRTLIDYTTAASLKLVEAAAQLTPEELVRDFEFSEKHVLGTLVHTFAGDRVWYLRVTGNVPGRFIDPEKDMHLRVLQEDWPKLLDRWREWADALNDEAVGTMLAFVDLKGNHYEQPIWQVVTHVVNHGTHHRGQVVGMLRAMGHTPPDVGLMSYYRSRNR